MGARKRLAAVVERLERDAGERSRQAGEAAKRARSTEWLAESFALQLVKETGRPELMKPAGRACAAVFERWNTRANLAGGSSNSLQGAANEIRAALAGGGITEGMDRQRHELLGIHGPAAIAAAKRHRVTVDAMMLSLAPLVAETNKLPEGVAPDLDAPERLAAAELYGEAPELADVPWPQPPPTSAISEKEATAKAERERVAKKLEARKLERERLAKAAKLAKAKPPKRSRKKQAAAK